MMPSKIDQENILLSTMTYFFSYPAYAFIYNMHLFATFLSGTKPGSYKHFSCNIMTWTSLFC